MAAGQEPPLHGQGWCQHVDQLHDLVGFFPAVAVAQLREAERRLGHALGTELTSLLSETDGIVEGEYSFPLVWNLDRITTDNLRFRASFNDLYMPFNHLLFFADAGNGDQFAFPVRPAKSGVYSWNHEDDSRTWAAPDLRTFLTWWATGRVRT